MKFASLIVIAALVTTAHAQTPGPKSTLPSVVSPDAILSVVTADWNSDGEFDRAVLVEGSDDEANLYVFLSITDKSGAKTRKLVVQKQNAAWRGRMWGTEPSLEINDKGTLFVKSGNDAVGRSRWSQTLTIVFRNEEFIVAGVTFNERDTLDPKATTACDLNLLTGQGIRNGKKIALAPRSMRLVEWNDDGPPKGCGG